MKPYYQDDAVTIYHGDCREILPGLGAEALVTDPPYGVGLGNTTGSGNSHGLVRAGYASVGDSYDDFVAVVVPALNEALRHVKRALVFTGPHIHEQTKPDAIGGIFCPAGAGRHGWGFKNFLPVLLYGTAPDLNLGARTPTAIESVETADECGHPCPKPMGWMRWAVSLASRKGETLLDPFCGSGTTLRAAKDLGRRAIGIEIEERYCEIAARRCAQGCLQLPGGDSRGSNKADESIAPGLPLEGL